MSSRTPPSGRAREDVHDDLQGSAVVFDASPGLPEQSSPMYLIGFTVPAGDDGANHPALGLPPSEQRASVASPLPRSRTGGAPGLGTSDTAGDYGARAPTDRADAIHVGLHVR